MKISICDTTICDDNLGNQIIMDSINPMIENIFPDAFIIKLQYLERYGKQSHRHIRESKYTFFGGTNALTSNMNRYSQMGFTLADAMHVRNVVLVGVGWWQYQSKPNFYTRTLLRRILHPDVMHSVRDEYTKMHLMSIGIENVVNTSCPTVWSLNKSHCKNISTKKNQKVVCTLTDYHQNPKFDTLFLLMMLKQYEHCYLWLQGAGDREYFDSLNLPAGSFKLVPPKLSAYDRLLSDNEVDYVGTRLHAGIRAMQRGRRALILSIDNRALEIGKNIGLNVCDRTDTNAISRFCCGGEESLLNIPQQEIELWRQQFIQ